MAKKKNHTNQNQNKKAHKNGIHKPKFHRFVSLKQVRHRSERGMSDGCRDGERRQGIRVIVAYSLDVCLLCCDPRASPSSSLPAASFAASSRCCIRPAVVRCPVAVRCCIFSRRRRSLPLVQCDPKFVRNLRYAKANNKRVSKAAVPAAAKKA